MQQSIGLNVQQTVQSTVWLYWHTIKHSFCIDLPSAELCRVFRHHLASIYPSLSLSLSHTEPYNHIDQSTICPMLNWINLVSCIGIVTVEWKTLWTQILPCYELLCSTIGSYAMALQAIWADDLSIRWKKKKYLALLPAQNGFLAVRKVRNLIWKLSS